MTDDVKERVARAVSSEGIHSAFRRHSNSAEAIRAWEAMSEIPADDWSGIMSAIAADVAEACLSALLPGDEINGCVLMPKGPADVRTKALLEAERSIVAREAAYRSDERAGIAATRLAALTVRRLRLGETATTYDDHVMVPRKILAEAHAVMRACGWQLAPASNDVGDGVLNLAAAEIEEKIGAMLAAAKKDDR